MKKIIYSIILLIMFSTLINTAHAGTISDDFNDGNTDGWWLGYSQHTPWKDGNWRIEDIGLPHNGIFIQDNLGDHFVALIENSESSSQTIETEIKLNDHGSYGGVTIWFQDDANWLNVLIYPAAGFINVYENINGIKTSNLYYYATSINTWYTIKVDANSDSGELDIYLDDVYLFTHNTNVINRNGRSGVNNGNASAYFDNFVINSPAIIDYPIDKSECKKNKWKDFSNLMFKNQGSCIEYLNNK